MTRSLRPATALRIGSLRRREWSLASSQPAGDEGEEPLAQECHEVVLDLGAGSRGSLGQSAMAAVQLAERQEPGIGSDLSALETGGQGVRVVKGKGELPWAVCHRMASLPGWSKCPFRPVLHGPGGRFRDFVATRRE